jgi:glycine betaine/proline transport system substrate-binding protein
VAAVATRPRLPGRAGASIKAAKFSWTAAELTNEIISQIAADHPELGVGHITETQLDRAAAWAGAARGDVQLLTEVALPNQQQLADRARNKVSISRRPAATRRRVGSCPSTSSSRAARRQASRALPSTISTRSCSTASFTTMTSGYITAQENTKRLAGYHIDYQHVIASEAAELAQLQKDYAAKKPIVVSCTTRTGCSPSTTWCS